MRYNNLMENENRINGEHATRPRIPAWDWLIIIALAAIGWKVFWLVNGSFPFNSDEAITGLMARHILQGERPVFFYGQSYMGSLDAFLTAGLFTLFGDTILTIRVGQIILYTCTIITTACLGRKLTGNWKTGLIAACLLAVPAVNVTLYTTVTLGGYGEALVLSNLAFLCAFELMDEPARYSRAKDILFSGLLGLIAGLGFWVLGITLVSTVPAILFSAAALTRRKTSPGNRVICMIVFILMAFVGSFPWWIPVWQTGLAGQFKELFGSAISIEKDNWFIRSGKHLLYFVFLGLPAAFGLRPPWEVRWLALPLMPFVLMIWGISLWKFPKLLNQESQAEKKKWLVLVTSAGFLAAGFVFTSFGLDPSGRYFLPLTVPLALMLPWTLKAMPYPKISRFVVPGVVILFAAVGTIQVGSINPPGITTQFDAVSWIDHRYDAELMDFLTSSGEMRGYSNYWVAYPLAFNSRETLLFSPRLPYHEDLRYTDRDDRIPAYTRAVSESHKTAYITTFNPRLDDALRKGFSRLNVTWQEKTIGDYHIYYAISQPVHPQELQMELTPIVNE